MIDITSMNANQIKAINWNEGPLLVLAGPGSGKTSVLAHRIAHLIAESAGESFRILGLTFTNKAATEMRKRINFLVPKASERVNLATYHSFSVAILRQHGHHLGISPDFTILSQDKERMTVLNEAIVKAGVANVEQNSQCLLHLVTRLTDQNITSDAAAEFLQQEFPDDAQQIGQIYGHYRRLMIENNELDFGGLVAEALKLLTETSAGKLVQRIYPYVCVDEFQDTSLSQYRMLCEIVNPVTKNLFAVADDDQIIYEWNGASPERIKQIQKNFEMTVLELPENYRCPSQVVDMANKLIANNPSHSRTDSVSGKPKDRTNRVRVMEFETAEDEADWIANDISELSVDSRRKCAVFARTRMALKRVVVALNKQGIHGHLHISKGVFNNYRMVWLYSILKLADSRQDGEQIRRICKSFYEIEGIELIVNDIVSQAMMAGGDCLRAWLTATLRKDLNPKTRSFLEDSMPNLADRLDVNNFVQDCFKWFEQRQKADPEPDYDTEYLEEKNVWHTLVTEFTADMDHKNMTLSALLQQIDLRSKEPPVKDGSIPCYTIFASKGMEFDHVYLISLSEDELPNWRSIKKGNQSREMQEERRVCFVAITRAKERLTLTYPLMISDYNKNPSRFLAEMGIEQDQINRPQSE